MLAEAHDNGLWEPRAAFGGGRFPTVPGDREGEQSQEETREQCVYISLQRNCS